MTEPGKGASFPERLKGSTLHPELIYELVTGSHARPAADPGSGYEVVDGDPGPDAWPLYRRGSDVAAASGRLFVRLLDGLRAQVQASAFAERGYEIDDVPSWALNAAWLRASLGGAAAALSGAPALEALPGVVNVEPELLRRRALK